MAKAGALSPELKNRKTRNDKRETTNDKRQTMNAYDYFFENSSSLKKPFLVGKEEITFPELHSTCLGLAAWMEDKVGQGKSIIILSVNNLFFLQVYLAVIKSGNICIPLDPGIEKENFRFINDLTKPELIFLTRDVEKRLELTDSKICVFPNTLPTMVSRMNGRYENEFDQERCAEIIFTSGSTGKPKGVMISHRNLIANTSSIVEYLKLTSD
ncbi:MAG: class I adenylate-forming enzyme family protein, partial [Bacteroidales bacterium]